ncbi:MAG: AI-2E family transporter [Clostridia bacterium]
MEMTLIGKKLKGIAPLALILPVVLCFPKQALLVVQLLVGGGAVAFLMSPMTNWLEGRMTRKIAVLTCAALTFAGLVALLRFVLPPLLAQVGALLQLAPGLFRAIEGGLNSIGEKLRSMGLPGFNPPAIDLAQLGGSVGPILSGTASFAGAMADACMKIGLSTMLGVYFLLDAKNLRIRMELLVPSGMRRLAIRMASDVARGLRVYLRGQMTIALIVGTLAAAGLALAGVKSPLVLGAIVGVFNMIPYFGPIIGGIPAVLTAMTQSFVTAIFCVVVLFVVQQLDGMVISPRVMSGATGLSPVSVLLALAVGGSGWGPIGMLLALPVLVMLRICFRVWASRHEVIENPPRV